MIIRNDDLYFVEIISKSGVLELEYVIYKQEAKEIYNIWDNHRCFILDQAKDYKKILKIWERRTKK